MICQCLICIKTNMSELKLWLVYFREISVIYMNISKGVKKGTTDNSKLTEHVWKEGQKGLWNNVDIMNRESKVSSLKQLFQTSE